VQQIRSWGVALLRSAGSGLRCLALLIRAGAASLCARTRGEPSSARCEQRLSERLTPCPCDPVCACTGRRGHTEKGTSGPTMQRGAKAPCISARAPTRSAASRAGMAGWAGEGGGRFGERREYEAPTLPSTPRQHDMARHHQSQARNATPTHKPAEKRHATTKAKPETTAPISPTQQTAWLHNAIQPRPDRAMFQSGQTPPPRTPAARWRAPTPKLPLFL